MREIKKEGTTIFLTTHYMEEADQLSDRISIIDHGKIIVTGSAVELKNKLGKDLIYLETSDNKAAAEILRTLESVKAVNEDTKSLRVMLGEDVTHILPKIMDKIREEGIEITTVNIKKPSMDDVFVHYTGHELREGDTEEKHEENGNCGGFEMSFGFHAIYWREMLKFFRFKSVLFSSLDSACDVACILWACNVKKF